MGLKIKEPLAYEVDHVLLALVVANALLAAGDVNLAVLPGGVVLMDPAGGGAGGFHALDVPVAGVEAEDLGALGRGLGAVAEAADDVDPFIHHMGAVEVGGREQLFGIAVDLEVALAIVNEHIVVDDRSQGRSGLRVRRQSPPSGRRAGE